MRGPSSLVGRDPLLAGLRGALDAALAGHGSLVLITGEPGIGKTALVTVFADEAAARGVRVTWSRCAEGEGVPAFWPWTQLLRATEGLPGGEDHLAPPAAEMTREAADRFRIFDRVTRHLAEAAAESGLLVVLDDLHWADPDSLGLLEFAARQLAASRLLLVGAYRDDDAADRLRRVAATAAVIRLEGLDTAGVGALMAQTTGGPVPEEAAAAMHTRTGGNPLFVRELTRLLQSRAAAGDRWASSATVDSVREVIDRRLARLSQPSTRMLTVAALDGARLRPWLLARVLGTAADIPALLEEAAAARVLVAEQDGFRFAHDLFREVLAAELPASTRRGLHRDLGAALQTSRAEGAVVHPAELAAHFLAAASGGDADAGDHAVRYSREAAADATERLAFQNAVTLLERALSLADLARLDGHTRIGLLLDVADARRLAGRLALAAATYRDAFSVARQLGDHDAAARAAIGLHLAGVKTGPSAERDSHAALLAAAAEALDGTSTALAAQVQAALARTLYHSLEAAQMAQAVPIAEHAVEIARDSGDPRPPRMRCRPCTMWPGVPARRTGASTCSAISPGRHPSGALSAYDCARSCSALKPSSNSATPAPSPKPTPTAPEPIASAIPLSRWQSLSRRAATALLAGRLDDAADLASRAERLAEDLGDADAVWIGDIQRWELARFTGERATYRRRRPGSAPPVETWPPWPALILAERGDHEGAARRPGRLHAPTKPGGRGSPPATTCGSPPSPPKQPPAAAATSCAATSTSCSLPTAAPRSAAAPGSPTAAPSTTTSGCSPPPKADHTAAAAHLDAATAQHLRLGAPRWAALSRQQQRPPAAPSEWTQPVPPGWHSLGGSLRRRPGPCAPRQGAAGHRRTARPSRPAHLGQRPRRHDHTISWGAGPRPAGAGRLPGQAPDLDDDIDEADANNDPERAARARAERDALIAELTRSVGRGGRPRRLGDDTEKARKTVTIRIQRALRLLDSHHPALASHLREAVRTGTTCSYLPAQPLTWEL